MEKTLSKLLIKKRGYVSKMPDNKKAVIIISGGLDSVVLSAQLIKDFDIELFPLHIHRGQKNESAENQSVDYFTKYFQKKYGKNKFHKPTKIKINVPPIEFKKYLQSYMEKNGHPLRDTIMQMLAVQYAVAISSIYHTEIKTIFSATGPEDPYPHCTFASFLSTIINTCESLADWNWTITSPNIDNNIFKKPFGKVETIIWANQNKLPINKTISCYNPIFKKKYIHCGQCLSCKRRKEAFIKANIEDKTKYLK